jgi:hypothetical protein
MIKSDIRGETIKYSSKIAKINKVKTINIERELTEEWFFPGTIFDWNPLPPPIVMSCSVETFEAAVSSMKYSLINLVNSFNPFQLLCATSDIIFNLLKAGQYLVEVEGIL